MDKLKIKPGTQLFQIVAKIKKRRDSVKRISLRRKGAEDIYWTVRQIQKIRENKSKNQK